MISISIFYYSGWFEYFKCKIYNPFQHFCAVASYAKLTLQTYYLFLLYTHESSFGSLYKIQVEKPENFTQKLLKNF